MCTRAVQPLSSVRLGPGTHPSTQLLPCWPLALQLVEAAEAKAYYGLAVNYQALTSLAQALLDRESLTGPEVAAVLEGNGGRRWLPGWLGP